MLAKLSNIFIELKSQNLTTRFMVYVVCFKIRPAKVKVNFLLDDDFL